MPLPRDGDDISVLCSLTMQLWLWSHKMLRWSWRPDLIPSHPFQNRSISVYGWEPSWRGGGSASVRGQHNLGNQSPGISVQSQQVPLPWGARLCHKTLTSERYKLEFISHTNNILMFSQWFPKIPLLFHFKCLQALLKLVVIDTGF